MAVQITSFPILLSVTIAIALSLAVRVNSSGITLDVSHNSKSDAQSGFLEINCSVDPSLSHLDTVASLAVFGSRPYGGKDEFDQLAVVDMWSNIPKLTNELEESDVTVSGQTGPGRSSSLFLSWNSPTNLYRHTYTCVANGIDRDGKAKTISTVAKVEVVSDGCPNIDSLTSELKLQSIPLKASLNVSLDIFRLVQSLDQRVGGLEAKIDAITLSSKVHSTLLAIDRSKFDVSDLYKDRLYLASKREAVFNLQNANNACQASGGYLVEIDDDEENQFAFGFAKKIGGSDHFALGGNDVKNEGKFVYFNSKKPVPAHVTWMRGQPNNTGGREDCMEIWLSKGGLNDIPCETKVKFMCEVPLRF